MSKTEKKQKKSTAVLFWKLFTVGVVSIVLLMFTISWGLFGKLPTFDELENPKFFLASEIITSDGKTLGNFYKENRINVEYEELSPHLVQGLIATEDERFHNHSGIDFRGLVRAIAFAGTNGGASTISQQLAKMLFHSRDQNKFKAVLQKLKEWIIASRLERSYTKNEIITMYYNQFDFINQAVGIRQASYVYFHKKSIDLTIAESAVLIGMFKNPSFFNPNTHPERALKRRNVVLFQMMRNKYIQKKEFDSLKTLPLALNFQVVRHNQGRATYFREMLKKQIQDILHEKTMFGGYQHTNNEGEPYNLYKDGLKIYTTIDSRLQNYAENAVAEHLGKTLQNQFDTDIKNNKYNPYNTTYSKEQFNAAIEREIKKTKRYRVLKGKQCGNCGRGANVIAKKKLESEEVFFCNYCEHTQVVKTQTEIETVFRTPHPTKIFSWSGNKKVNISPIDSIKYMKGILHAGFLSMQPSTGYIRAWVGGIDKRYFSYDHVSQSKRQVGSTIKPILYSLAINDGVINPCDEIPNLPYKIEKGKFGLMEDWQPNYSPKFTGMLNYKYGLANSMNNVAVHIMGKISPEALETQCKKMGITSPLNPTASLCLGTSDISLIEMVGAYGVFANEGIWNEPIFLLRIEDKYGNPIYTAEQKISRALSEETAYIMLDMMKGVVDGVYNESRGKKSGTSQRIRWKYGIKAPIAGKTGTTQNSTDGWFIGITPDLVSGAWVGAEDASIHFNSGSLGQGANMALPIWGLYMKSVYQDKTIQLSIEDFTPPNPQVKKNLECKKEGDDPFS
ncbi:MAG: transglycosylase domain-containing protein [Flavobacteriales bacterium]|nr:transglycosylase domain-containing protein [Flavobacteriales bacterium]